MSYAKQLSSKELLASIPKIEYVAGLFVDGIEMWNDRLAIAAMEELLRRGDSNTVAAIIGEMIDDGTIRHGNVFTSMFISALAENDHDALLRAYGQFLMVQWRHGHSFESPEEWAASHTNFYERSRNSGVVRNAPDWAKANFDFLPAGEVSESRLAWERDKKNAILCIEIRDATRVASTPGHTSAGTLSECMARLVDAEGDRDALMEKVWELQLRYLEPEALVEQLDAEERAIYARGFDHGQVDAQGGAATLILPAEYTELQAGIAKRGYEDGIKAYHAAH